nr:uncharacterized protein LOC109731336 [Microcebus murinus]
MSNAGMTHYQSLLLDSERVSFGAPVALNPATLLPEEHPENREVLHSCHDILAEETGPRKGLWDEPLPNPHCTWFTDGSSCIHEGKRVNIYTDSRYAFATAHIHGAIYRQRGLLTSAGKEIKNKQEILHLLEAIHVPQEVAIIHCSGHQKGTSKVAQGNKKADFEAKQAALRSGTLILAASPPVASPTFPHYSSEEEESLTKKPAKFSKDQQGV